MGTNALNDRRAGLDVPLTTLSIGIPTDQDFIGDRLLPPLPQPLSVATIPVWGTEAFRIREDKVGDFSEPDKLDISIDKTTFEVDGHALMAPVSRRHQIEASRGPLRYDLDMEALQTVVASMDLAREAAQAALMTSQAIYGATHKADMNGDGTRFDDATVDPLDTLVPYIESTIPFDSGKRPNVIWMGQEVWAKLILHPLLRARAYGTIGPVPMLTTSKLADLIGIPTVLVGRAISKTIAGVNTKLWGKNVGLTYVPPTSGKRVPAFGYTVEQTVFGGASEAVIRIADEKMGASGGDWIKRSSFYTPTSLFPNAGVLLYNAVA